MNSYDVSLTPVFLLSTKKTLQIIHHSEKAMETRIMKKDFQ